MDKFDGITAKAAAPIVGVPRQRMRQLAEATGIRRRVLPGSPVLYDRGDCERVAREAIVGGRTPELVGSSN